MSTKFLNGDKKYNIEKYNKNPKICRKCNNIMPYNKRSNIYCNHSCSATITNKGNTKYDSKSCVICNKNMDWIPNYSKILTCSKKCRSVMMWEKKKIEIEKGLISHRRTLRRYLIEKHGCLCDTCKIDKWMNKQIILEVDHIDGNINNNLPINLRLTCPNCHSQTPTWKARNKGKYKNTQVWQNGYAPSLISGQ